MDAIAKTKVSTLFVSAALFDAVAERLPPARFALFKDRAGHT